jgi:thioredoxin-related protein
MYRTFITVALCFFVTGITNAQSINWLSLQEAQSKAAEDNKKVLIFAEADWCGYCQKMNQKVFPESSVADSLGKYFYPVRLNIESGDKIQFNGQTITEQSLARRFRARSRTPTTVFLDSEGAVIGTQPGFMPQHIFDKLLGYVGSDLYNQFAFKKYLNKHDVETE